MTSSGQSPRYFKMNGRASRCRPAKRSPFANLRPTRQIFAGRDETRHVFRSRGDRLDTLARPTAARSMISTGSIRRGPRLELLRPNGRDSGIRECGDHV